MPELATLSLWPALALALACAGAIFWAGPRLAHVVETLARRTGLGQAMSGALLLGMTTSLPGTITSVTAAATGHPQLAIANGLGGIAAQTAFLAAADCFHRGVNLEHASASSANIFQLGLLMTLLAMTLMAFMVPDVAIFSVHPVSIALPIAYIAGLRIARQIQSSPMWQPRPTSDTIPEEGQGGDDDARSTRRLWLLFSGYAGLAAIAGFGLTVSAVSLSDELGISESVIGAVGTSIITSLPELVTTVAAVRRGALALAVGDIIGGNAFDTLFTSLSDVAYRAGSIYSAASARESFLTTLGMLLSSVLLLGLLARERHGPGRIGTESVLLLVLYIGGVVVMAMM